MKNLHKSAENKTRNEKWQRIQIDVFSKMTQRCPTDTEKVLNITNHRRVQVKTALRYHFMPVRITIINKTISNKPW